MPSTPSRSSSLQQFHDDPVTKAGCVEVRHHATRHGCHNTPIAPLGAIHHRCAALRWLRRVLFLPRRSVGRGAFPDRGPRHPGYCPPGCDVTDRPDDLRGSAGLCAGKVVPGRPGRFLGWAAQLPDRPGWCDSLHLPVCHRHGPADLHVGLGRQPAHPVTRLGGADQGGVQVVRLHLARRDCRHPQCQLPGRRRPGTSLDGPVD